MVKGINYDSKTQLKPGRRFCLCQARIHELVRNCLNCGRIVCQQEGSGSCFNCGTLVCTREEQRIVSLGDKKSYDLLKKLDFSVTASGSGISFDAISNNLLKNEPSINIANEYKEKLFAADKNCDSTKVNDLESDYYTVEHNAFLNPEERESIIRRKEELRQMALEAKKKIIFNLDITNKTITDAKKSEIETINDPVIQAILTKAICLRNTKSDFESQPEKEEPSAEFLRNFVPKYVGHGDSSLCNNQKTEVKILHEKSRTNVTWCIALPPLLALRLAKGERSHIPWKEEVRVRGPILIASLANWQFSELLNEDDHLRSSDSPESSIVGRAIIVECLNFEEYKMEYPDNECCNVEMGFVILFEMQEELFSPLIHLSPAELYPVEKSVAELVRKNLVLIDNCNGEYTSLEFF